MQFRNADLFDVVVSALKEAGLAPNRLEIEITETLLLDDAKTTQTTLKKLRKFGVRIAMDDFGTGHSSLSYLRSFPFDKLKIDKSFITSVEPGNANHAIFKAIVSLGKSLQMSVTAEGIETEAQLDIVRAEGCDEAQGFLFSRPLPAHAVAAMIEAVNFKTKALHVKDDAPRK